MLKIDKQFPLSSAPFETLVQGATFTIQGSSRTFIKSDFKNQGVYVAVSLEDGESYSFPDSKPVYPVQLTAKVVSHG